MVDHNNFSNTITFLCNICGSSESLPHEKLHRELLHCTACGSSPRFRGVVRAFQQCVLGDVVTPLVKALPRQDLVGLGMSDWEGYGRELGRICQYTNTFYHDKPFLDIASRASSEKYTNLDFVICSEVLEHVVPPVSTALENIWGMLKPGGYLILSVPSLEGYETIEHYPHIHEFSIDAEDGASIVLNKRPDGLVERIPGPIFHGGPGSVLEMRVFGEACLSAMLRYVGFHATRLEFVKPIGYFWEYHCENPLWRGRTQRSHILYCRKSLG
jgi:hypothetical protein